MMEPNLTRDSPMIKPTLPSNEKNRLNELNELFVLDTDADPQLDEIVELASAITGCSVALVSLVDKDRQWFKARVGVNVQETHRDISFCGHAIHSTELMEIPDAREDQRFHDNPLVVQAPHIRFYAGQPLVTSKGHNIGTLCVIDTSPKKLTERQKKSLHLLSHQVMRLLEMRRDLEHERAKSAAQVAHLAYLTHELRTPLTSMVGYANLIKEETQASTGVSIPELQKYADTIAFSASHLMELIQDIMDFSKLRSGKLETDIAAISTTVFFNKIVDLFIPAAKEKNISLQCKISANVPVTFNSDSGLIRQITLNLMGNAIKFTHQGNVTLLISVDDKSHSLLVDVIDTGIGMSPEEADRLFVPFTQANTGIAKQFQGSGLGLFIARGLAEALGGFLTIVRTVKGQGTHFRFSLPLSKTQAVPAVEPDKTAVTTPEKLRILLVDDSRDNRFLFTRFLAKEPVVIDEVENGLEAVEACRNGQYDLVFLDMQLPDMNGMMVLEAIKKLQLPSLPKILAFTAAASYHENEIYQAKGFGGLVPKPFTKETLKLALKI